MQLRSKAINMLDKLKEKILSGESRTVSVKKNIVGSFLNKGISIVISFMLVPLTIGYVSPELYGVWLTVSSILTWLCFLDIGFTQGLKNKLTEALAYKNWELGKSFVSTTYFMMIVIFIPVCVILELCVPIINWTKLLNVDPIYAGEIVRVMYVLIAFVCIQMVANVLVSVVAAYQKVALSNTFAVIGNLLSLIIIFILTKTCPPSLMSLSFTLAAMPIIVTIIASFILYSKQFRKVAPNISHINKTYVSQLFGLGYKFFIINIQVVVVYQATNILISNVSSPLQVTTYNIAYKYLSIAMMAYSIITAPLWPAYTDAYAKRDFAWMKRMRYKMMLIFSLSSIGCIILAIISQPVYHLWIGDKVFIPNTMTAMVTLYVILFCWMNLNGTLIVGMGKVHLETYIVLVGMCVHVPLSLFLSKFFGVYGVILSMIFINFSYAILFHVQVDKLLNRTATGIWLK